MAFGTGILILTLVFLSGYKSKTAAAKSSGNVPGTEIPGNEQDAVVQEMDPAGDKDAGASTEDGAPAYEPEVEEVYVRIPGLEKEYTILWVSDLHICTGGEDPDVTPDHAGEVQERTQMFLSLSGKDSTQTWQLLSSRIDPMGADYVVFGADMADYASAQNLSVLKAGMEKLQTPWMYIRADHDYARWYGDMDIDRMRELQQEIAPQNKIWVQRFEGFTLVGLDNTTTSIADETLEELQKVYEEGNPILLCTHVPFDTGSSDCETLAGISRQNWGDRVLCWGVGDEYDTRESASMQAVLDMIKAPGSPVAAVFAGHLHRSWEGSLTDTCLEHVFGAAFEDCVGLIHVVGEE